MHAEPVAFLAVMLAMVVVGVVTAFVLHYVFIGLSASAICATLAWGTFRTERGGGGGALVGAKPPPRPPRLGPKREAADPD